MLEVTKNSADQRDYIVINKLRGDYRKKFVNYWCRMLLLVFLLTVVALLAVYYAPSIVPEADPVHRDNSDLALIFWPIAFVFIIFLSDIRPLLTGGKIYFRSDGFDFMFGPRADFFIYYREITGIQKKHPIFAVVKRRDKQVFLESSVFAVPLLP